MKKDKKTGVVSTSDKQPESSYLTASAILREEVKEVKLELKKCKEELQQLRNRNLSQPASMANNEPLKGSYRKFCDTLPSGDFLLSREGEIRDVNLLGAKLLNQKPHKLIGTRFIDFILPEGVRVFQLFLAEVFTSISHTSHTTALEIKGSSTLFVHVRGILSMDGESCNMIVCDAFNKQLESALAQSEQKYSKFYQSIMEGFVYTDMEGNIKETNEIFQKIVGYTAEELQQMTYLDLTPKKWYSFENKIVREQIIPFGYSEVYEKEYIRKDGTILPVELRTVLIKNESGENGSMWAFVRDISQRKMADLKIKENESLLEESQRIGKLGSYILDVPGNRYTCSEVLDSIFGIEKDSVKNLESWIDIVAPEYKNVMLKYFLHDVIHERHPFDMEYEIIRANDQARRWVWGHGELTLDENGVPVKMIGIIQDIDDRKRIEEALRRSELEYKDTLNSLPDWVFVVDEQLHLITINWSFKEECTRQGISYDNIGSKITSKIPFISSAIIEAIEHVFLSGAELILSEKVVLSGKTIYAEIRVIPFIQKQKTEKVITVIRDRSKEREIDELKIKNLEQKEILLKEIHHRVKNNLSIVISLLNFQLRKYSDPKLNRIIQEIQMRIRSMALIHEHLYLSENLDRIPLASYIKSLISYITTTYKIPHIHLESDLEPMDLRIETALPLGLIANELLTNAFKYAFTGLTEGEIRIKLSTCGNECVRLSISDNGIGLPEEITLNSEDSLGLFIVSLLTEQLEGKIEILRNKGTEFILTFSSSIIYNSQQNMKICD
jgi:PAS domain S-box-containing protein